MPPQTTPAAGTPRLQPAFALRRALSQGYGGTDLKADLAAGTVVGIVALPLSMALAIASGVPPQHGLYTAVVAGCVIAVLGGSRTQVSGPTAAFVAVLAPVAARFGFGGLALASALAGILLILLSVSRLGRLIQLMPYPVTTGFTAGIGVVIASLQLRDFLGLRVAEMPAELLPRVAALGRALPTIHAPDLLIGLLTLGLLIVGPRVQRRIPAPLLALSVAAVAAAVVAHVDPSLSVDTLNSRFSYLADGVQLPGIPRRPPLPLLPWHLPGPGGAPLGLSWELVQALLPAAFAIAMLGAIESLLSAVVADGMTRHRHDPDSELLAQGVGNLVAPFFGGFAATGAIARTATSIRSGARSPIAAVWHSAVVLAAMLALAPWLGYLPMASLAALLLVVAWNMAEARHVLHTLRSAPRSDSLVLLVCFGLTALFDMVTAVTVGVALASFLFLRRMVEVSGIEVLGPRDPVVRDLPPGVVLYRIAGPLFFGAAHKAMTALHTVEPDTRVVLLDLRAVPALDATGLVNLGSALDALHAAGVRVVLGGLQDQPFRALIRAGWRHREVSLHRSFERALTRAREFPGLVE